VALSGDGSPDSLLPWARTVEYSNGSEPPRGQRPRPSVLRQSGRRLPRLRRIGPWSSP